MKGNSYFEELDKDLFYGTIDNVSGLSDALFARIGELHMDGGIVTKDEYDQLLGAIDQMNKANDWLISVVTLCDLDRSWTDQIKNAVVYLRLQLGKLTIGGVSHA